MSTETQPSEHAIATARYLFPMGASIAEKSPDGPTARRMIENARYIDQHAIVPAVAERDRRIKELVDGLRDARASFLGLQPDFGGPIAAQMGIAVERITAALAKHGGAHE